MVRVNKQKYVIEIVPQLTTPNGARCQAIWEGAESGLSGMIGVEIEKGTNNVTEIVPHLTTPEETRSQAIREGEEGGWTGANREMHQQKHVSS